MEGNAEECAEFGIRAESGVFGTELCGGESSGFKRVRTCKPLFAELSVMSRISQRGHTMLVDDQANMCINTVW